MKKILVFMLLIPSVFSAYELGMSGIPSPSPLNQFATEFNFQHRFYGDMLNSNSSFLGMDQGANANLGLSFYPLKGLAVSVSWISYERQTFLGTSYSHVFPKLYLKGRLGIDSYTYPESDEDRFWGMFTHLTLQTTPIFKRIKPLVTVGFDSDNGGIFNWGAGLSVTVLKDIYLFEQITLVGEFHPRPRGMMYIPEQRADHVFLFGIGASTYGHQFLFTLSNTTHLGAKDLMYGRIRYFEDEGLELRLGFTIRRLLYRGRE